MCGKGTEKNDRTLRCSGCLLWRHICCAGLSLNRNCGFADNAICSMFYLHVYISNKSLKPNTKF
nr:unnamed protein product [Callosobruchus analis]